MWAVGNDGALSESRRKRLRWSAQFGIWFKCSTAFPNSRSLSHSIFDMRRSSRRRHGHWLIRAFASTSEPSSSRMPSSIETRFEMCRWGKVIKLELSFRESERIAFRGLYRCIWNISIIATRVCFRTESKRPLRISRRFASGWRTWDSIPFAPAVIVIAFRSAR